LLHLVLKCRVVQGLSLRNRVREDRLLVLANLIQAVLGHRLGIRRRVGAPRRKGEGR
jgi:hypothetical protein